MSVYLTSKIVTSKSCALCNRKFKKRCREVTDKNPQLIMTDLETKEEANLTKDTAVEEQVSRRLSALLSDLSLKKAIIRLIHHLHKKSGDGFTEETAASYLQQLTQISVQQGTLQTQQHKEDKTKKLFIVDNREGNPRQSVICLNAEACRDIESNWDRFLQVLVSAIHFVLGVNLDSLLLYRLLKSPRQADEALDEAGIKECGFQTEKDHSISSKPGTFVPVRNHHQLDNHFHELNEGEHVAYEVYDPLMVCGDTDSKDIVPVYIYATIIREVCDSDVESIPLFAKRYYIDLGPDRGEADVSVTRLYRIISETTVQRSPTSSLKQQTAPHKEKDDQIQDLSAILKDIRQVLTKVWKVSRKEECQCVMKRLLLEWHPDKNSGKESLCTHVIQAVLHYSELLNQGESLPEDDSTEGASDSVDGWSVKSTSNLFARSYTQRQIYRARYMADHNMENPQPGEGWRWFHTAQCDMAAARASRGICEHGRNWVCFLCHQAVEKALKGVLYFRNADDDGLQSHSLPQLARRVSDAPLVQLAQQMESRMGPHTRMRYPDVLVYPNVPADVYTEDDVDMACDVAWHALERAQYLMSVM